MKKKYTKIAFQATWEYKVLPITEAGSEKVHMCIQSEIIYYYRETFSVGSNSKENTSRIVSKGKPIHKVWLIRIQEA